MARFSYTAAMSKTLQAHRVNILAFAQEATPFNSSTLLQKLERINQETQGLPADLAVDWHAQAELRPAASGGDQVWLHLQADALLPLTCQRCMAAVDLPLHVDQWFRFVDSEDIAMAEDDASDEDLLVMAPQFDLLALLEDELLMAIPLVPMHDECPVALTVSAGQLQPSGESADTQASNGAANGSGKPNPFAVLAQLKNGK